MKGRDILLFILLVGLLLLIAVIVDGAGVFDFPLPLDVNTIIILAGTFTIIAVVRDAAERD